ncbi:PorP/SprF family type IX secretion system membrane protein [Tamlana flava]|uniref:PorP/SprF family type IX secretion system membrane protein n=1 Tax=Tamlana flava TaxID=3158572 RepID=UPI00351B94FE
MTKHIVHIILLLCFIQQLYPQNDDGVVAFDIPARNSLKFNRYIINPTFSFVREQNRYISFNNKREWVQFDDAPQTYLFSYSGRFRENIGIGAGLFQQNYGVLTNFGGILNFAYNAVLDRESNLTFGLNLGFNKSGINDGNVIANFPDPSLNNIPSNSVISINPAINYGTAFFDFGLSVNNLVSYNLTNSAMIEDNPAQALQAHIMYTGYVNSRGFFDESKFSGLLRSEFQKDETLISGIMMLTVPKGIWGQVGYNTLYGMSAGIGLNISEQLAIEYNYEKAMGNLSAFGNSHDITLAFKFNNSFRYNYSGDDEEEALLIPSKRKNTRVAKRRTSSSPKPRKKSETKVAQTKYLGTNGASTNGVEETKIEVAQAETLEKGQQEQTRLAEEASVKAEKEEQARIAELARVKAEQEKEARLAEEARIKAETEERSRIAEAGRIKAEQEEQVRLFEEARIKAEQEKEARLAEEARIKAETEEKVRIAEAARIKAEQEEQARIAKLARVKAEKEKEARLAEEARIKAETEEKARIAEAARIKTEQEEQARIAELARVKAEQEKEARLAEEAKIKAETEEKARIAETARVKAEQKEQLRLAEEARIQAEEEAKQKLVEETQVSENNIVSGFVQKMNDLAKSSEETNKQQRDLLLKLTEKVASKQKDLDDLKEENDLSEQGIYQEPKAFKSVSAENAVLESLKTEIDDAINEQSEKIAELENLYQARLKKVKNKNDAANLAYLETIESLKDEQSQIVQSKEELYSTLAEIKVATEIERKRRIKRALYDNQEDQYNKDRASLERIKKFTEPSTEPLTSADFDSGEELTNIQIVKGIANIENGYYMVVAVHSNKEKRDEFLTKAIASGEENIDFFFDVNTNKYYIYNNKFDSLDTANTIMGSKGSKPYNSNMSIVKVEN